MAKRFVPEYPMVWQDFGASLFKTKDSDPGYILLNLLSDHIDDSQLLRMTVAWCTFYNLGIAADASEYRGGKFYDYLLSVYQTAKRASERRHFRGAAGLKAIGQWSEGWKRPEKLAEFLLHSDLAGTREACAHVAQMGPYFVWKWGDLYEVLRREPCKFVGYEHWSPKVPLEGAALIAKEAGYGFKIRGPVEEGTYTAAGLYNVIRMHMNSAKVQSPYAKWRKFDVQDSETVCCVYKQYRNGTYWPGVRTSKALARLRSANSKTARLAHALLLENSPYKDFGVDTPEFLEAPSVNFQQVML